MKLLCVQSLCPVIDVIEGSSKIVNLMSEDYESFQQSSDFGRSHCGFQWYALGSERFQWYSVVDYLQGEKCYFLQYCLAFRANVGVKDAKAREQQVFQAVLIGVLSVCGSC